MVDLETKKEIQSRCGICCSECSFLKEGTCKGCLNIEKPFWGDSCQVKSCCESKKISCCGKCDEFPCEILKAFAYDKEQGDNGLRIENCIKWCSQEK